MRFFSVALNPLLKIQDLHFGYHFTELLNGLNCNIFPQDRIALIGPSGSGKSTFFKIIAGLLSPQKGSVIFQGTSIHKASPKELNLLRKKMGLLFQKNALFDHLNALDNIVFSLKESHTEPCPDKASAIALHHLESVGLGHALQLLPDEMSGGMQKRLGIARAQALKPDFLLYDDPTAGLDPITSRHIIDLILTLQQECQSTLIVITNEILRAFQLATRIFFLCHGELLDLGSPTQAKHHPDPRVQQFLKAQAEGPLQKTI
jgi:phospholipid/cholesterol/gamma-HCH transport system ATP-binding protein